MFCRIVKEPISGLDDILDRLRSDADGAVILFAGVVRGNADGRAVDGLHYEAYADMARSKLERLCEDTLRGYDVTDIAVIHRVGDLELGDTSVVIAVSAPHREAAYAASREVIERLKHEIPIWKREKYVDGGEEWLEGAVPPS